jgi:hypothetical protein
MFTGCFSKADLGMAQRLKPSGVPVSGAVLVQDHCHQGGQNRRGSSFVSTTLHGQFNGWIWPGIRRGS